MALLTKKGNFHIYGVGLILVGGLIFGTFRYISSFPKDFKRFYAIKK